MSADFQVSGTNASALFTLKAHRGEGMLLLGMDWKTATPTDDFVGFAIDYKEPDGDRFFPLKNRLCFPGVGGSVNPQTLATTLSPIQKFRWVHFPRNADLDGDFVYRVSPVFMNEHGELSSGDAQEVAIELRRETYPGVLNVAFTRGFVASQAFIDRFASPGAPMSTLLPGKADDGLTFTATHPKKDDALPWMGFEARSAVLEILDQAIADGAAKVGVVAFELNEPEVLSRLEQLGSRVRVILDDSGKKNEAESAESQAEVRLVASAGRANVKRQHMGSLQHNKMVIVDGPQTKTALFGSTNFSWRGFFVQSNNAMIVHGASVVRSAAKAFEGYWQHNDVAGFGKSGATGLVDLGLAGIDAHVAFSPHTSKDALLKKIGDDIGTATSSVLYSMAFLAQTSGAVRDALKKVTEDPAIFVYGIADREVGGIELQTPDANKPPTHPARLDKHVPEPFKSEESGGGGVRLHHKFVVIDFDKPTARVYLGSYNFSDPADRKNGENLVLVKDRRIAVAYAVEALRIFDHYHFRAIQEEAGSPEALTLAKPPVGDEKPWWDSYYSDPQRARDREIFA